MVLMLTLAVEKYEQFNMNDSDINNLFVSIGCLIVKNYADIILNYDRILSADVKDLLTLVINNLLLSNQLQNRIFSLREEIESIEFEIENVLFLVKDTKEELLQKENNLKNSLAIKENKLRELNQENVNILLDIGKIFYQEDYLSNKVEFKELYNNIDYLLVEDEELFDFNKLFFLNVDKSFYNWLKLDVNLSF